MGKRYDYRSSLKMSFRIAAVGAAVCTICACIDLFYFLNDSIPQKDFEYFGWISVIGVLVLGGGLISAGIKLCALGHKETGVTTAGVGLIFVGAIKAVMLLPETKKSMVPDSTSYYVWIGLYLLGFVIAYYAMKHGSMNEGKFFDKAAYGFGMIVVVEVIVYVVLIKIMMSDHSDALSGDPDITTKIAIWVSEHQKIVGAGHFGAIALGYLLAWISLGNNSGFIDDITDDDDDYYDDEKEEKEKLIEKALAEYRERHANDYRGYVGKGPTERKW